MIYHQFLPVAKQSIFLEKIKRIDWLNKVIYFMDDTNMSVDPCDLCLLGIHYGLDEEILLALGLIV